MRNISTNAVALTLALALFTLPVFGQEVVLRDLNRIRGIPVKKVDDEFLALTDGTRFSWDQVLQVRVDPVWQKQVERRIASIGLPLYRLKHRLQQQNIAGAYKIAQHVYSQPDRKFVGHEANFLVCRAVMLGRIELGQRAAAVEPMIRAIELQEKCATESLEAFSGLAFSDRELRTAICDDLLPVWGSIDETKLELERLSESFDLDSLAKKWPGLAVYLATMAVHVRQRERISAWNVAIGSVPELRPWQRMLDSDLSRAPLARLIEGSRGPFRATAMYWWATSEGQQAPKSRRVLTLLKIFANYRDEFPQLARAAIDRAALLTDDPDARAVLQRSKQ